MGTNGSRHEELLARIAAIWLRHRDEASVISNMPERLRALLDEAVLRVGTDREAVQRVGSEDAEQWTDDTPTETPASRRNK